MLSFPSPQPPLTPLPHYSSHGIHTPHYLHSLLHIPDDHPLPHSLQFIDFYFSFCRLISLALSDCSIQDSHLHRLHSQHPPYHSLPLPGSPLQIHCLLSPPTALLPATTPFPGVKTKDEKNDNEKTRGPLSQEVILGFPSREGSKNLFFPYPSPLFARRERRREGL